MLWVRKNTSRWDGSFEHPKHMLKLWVRKYLQFYAETFWSASQDPMNSQTYWLLSTWMGNGVSVKRGFVNVEKLQEGFCPNCIKDEEGLCPCCKNSEGIMSTYSKTCVKQPLSKRPKLVFTTNYRLMKVKSIAECSKGSILQYFWLSLSYHLSLRYLFCLFLSGRFTQVLLYI